MKAPQLRLFAPPGLPEVREGQALAPLILEGVRRCGEELEDGDVVVVAQKIVSKSEGRLVALDSVEPSARAQALAEKVAKDPRLVELILEESREVVRSVPGVLIVEHRLGIVLANAGIDQSNIEHSEGESVLLLPVDPDASAAALRESLEAATGRRLGVVICDSVGRPWRLGTVGLAIGLSGVPPYEDKRGGTDRFGRELKVTLPAVADGIASAAVLLLGEAAEATPVAVLRGFRSGDASQGAAALVRPKEQDLFR